ncbi:MAG: histidine kinase [uncultured bacterium]|nr:MAG: histidine kinase [uncultured bacterium]HBG21215.1 hypothetical protein [Desulfobulbaceae bacterium]
MKRLRMVRAILVVVLVVVFGNGTVLAALELTREEQAWLKEHHRIRISGPQAFPPFQYVDSDGAFKGMASDYILHIAEMVGLEVEIVMDLPWSDILTKIENRDIDLLTCATVTSERQKYLLYTKPHIVFPLIIVGRKDGPFLSGLASLRDKKIAVTYRNSTGEWLQRDGIAATPQIVQSPLEALKEVSLGNADAAIENLAAATYLIEKHGLTNLKIAAPTSWEDYALSIAVRRDWPELVAIFDKGLAAMSFEEHNAIRQKWIAVRYEHGIGVKDIVFWTAVVGGIAALLVAVFYLWNRRLAREIEIRRTTEAEKEKLIVELTGALKEIKTLRGILPICCECKNIRDDKGYWMQIEEYISTHSEADFSHGLCPICIDKLYAKEEWYQENKADIKGIDGA